MAKLAFSKINKIKNLPAEVHDFNGCSIEVEQYLPLSDKMDLIISVIDQSGNGEEGFFNLVKLKTYYIIEMIKSYTNISFTDKQSEDVTKLYDALMLNGVWAFVENKIPQSEREYIWFNILELAKQVTAYNSSAMGIIKMLTQNKEQLNLDLTDIMSKINDPEALTTIKEILGLTGITE